MLSGITTFTPTSINGSTTVGDLTVNINVTDLTISGNVLFQNNTPGQYLSISIDKSTGKSSVSFSADDSTVMLALVEDITTKLQAIRAELGN